MHKNVAVIILAAGLGTRMKSDKAKVLHTVLGKPMVSYVTEAAAKIAGNEVIVVIGHQAEEVREIVLKNEDVKFSHQDKQLGTGHAVMCAMPHLSDNIEKVVILCGDVPLLSFTTVSELVDTHEENGNDVTVLAINLDKPTGYGRIIIDERGNVEKIVEEADASDAEKRITTVNSGVYCVDREYLVTSLGLIKSDNAQGELYLTDIIGIVDSGARKAGMVLCPDANELVGVNSVADLKNVENIMLRKQGKIS